MKLAQFADSIRSKLQVIFPGSFINVYHDTNLCDCVILKFSVESKEEWINNIFHNAHFVILMISCKNARRESENNEYQIHEPTLGLKTKFRRKSGSLEKIEEHLLKFFANVHLEHCKIA